MKSILSLTIAFSTSTALASVNVQTLTSAVNSDYIVTESATVNRPDEYSLGVHYHFVDNPLVEFYDNNVSRRAVVVDGIHTLSLKPVWVKNEKSVGLDIPLHQVKFDGESYRWCLGDFRVVGAMRLAESKDKTEAFALVPELVLPTGNASRLVSNNGWGIGLRTAYEKDFKLLKVGANLGFRYFTRGQYRDLDYRKQMPVSVAVYMPIAGIFGANAEYFQTFTFHSNKTSQNPGEMYLGGRVFLFGIEGFAGTGIGQTDFDRSNDLRVHMGARIAI